MPDAILGMPFRKEFRAESDECRVSDTISEITRNGHKTSSRHVEVDGLAVFEKRLH
jgi:hypothetical protein